MNLSWGVSEIAAEGEVEVDAVLEAEVGESEEGAAGGVEAALGFEDGEGIGEASVVGAGGEIYGVLGFFYGGGEAAVLLIEEATGGECCFDFLEGGEGGCAVVFDDLFGLGCGEGDVGTDGSATDDGLGESACYVPDE